MWIKKIPGIAVNVAVLILHVFAILMIVGLFLHQLHILPGKIHRNQRG